MSTTLSYREAHSASRDQARTLFFQTMGYVATTTGVFALGTYLGRHLTGAVGISGFVAAFACLIGLLLAFRVLIGLAVAPTIAHYANAGPRALWEAGVPPHGLSPGPVPPGTPPSATSLGWRGLPSELYWR